MSDELERIISETIRSTRDDTLDAAIELCEEYARTGHTAHCCVEALRRLKRGLPLPPSKQD